MLTTGDLFSGIGGFIAAAKSAGLRTLFSCEIDPWLNELLSQNYPGLIQYRDIKEMVDEEIPHVDILTASPPCQPVSSAGQRKGSRDDRFLWNETIAVIRRIRPRWFIIENVPGLASMVEFDCQLPVDAKGYAIGNPGDLVHRTGRGIGSKIMEALEAEGYSLQVFDIPAAAVDAQHLRHRLWIVANLSRERGGGLPEQPGEENIDIDGSGQEVMADANRRQRSLYRLITGMGWKKQSIEKNDTDANESGFPWSLPPGRIKKSFKKIRQKRIKSAGMDSKERSLLKFASRDFPRWWPVEPQLGRVAYGIPDRVHRIKGLGNAIVPQVAEVLLRYILEIEKLGVDKNE